MIKSLIKVVEKSIKMNNYDKEANFDLVADIDGCSGWSCGKINTTANCQFYKLEDEHMDSVPNRPISLYWFEL